MYSFQAINKGDGSEPKSDLTYANGVLYGTTFAGGPSTDYGTVFELTPSGTETVLSGFNWYPNGAGPLAGVTFVNGVLYGTTIYGGAFSQGQGTVYALTL